MTFNRRTYLTLSTVAFALAGGPISLAQVPSPRTKPPVPNLSKYLTDSDAKYFRSALKDSRARRWPQFTASRRQVKDPVARDILTWVQAANDTNASMADLTYVVQNLSDWPRMTRIRSKAEVKLFDNPISSDRTIAWFGGQDPVSGEGRAVLAQAYFAQRNTAEGTKWLKLAWRESKLTRDRQRTVFGRYKDQLTQDDHAARADHLIWEGSGHFSKARALLPQMSRIDSAIMDARLRVAANASGMDAAINRVPASSQSDTGLLFERARWRRRRRSKEAALPLYLAITKPPVSEQGRKRLWIEKKIMTYWAIEERRYSDGYNLTLNHGFTRGSEFAEAEFLAGWFSLVKLRNAQQALTHFTRLSEGVSFPVSLSRAYYWMGRAHQSLQTGQDIQYFQQAASFSNTFYGFLAGEKLGGQGLSITLPFENDPSYLQTQFASDRRVRAMELLGEAQNERYYNQFSFHMDDAVGSLEELSLLSGMGRDFGYMKPSVRAAKQASRFQSMLTESGYPMPETITSLPSEQFNIPFVLAIARQESEFNTSAVSSARAYGMMQMINSTAKSTARLHRIPYSRSRMTVDGGYSARLGALHLHDLLRKYDGSYIMAAAAYNAGSSRVSQWVGRYGDPRAGRIDPIDWLESIPFTETRNYIQRVMENMQVYRARMNGNTAQNRVYMDIRAGAF